MTPEYLDKARKNRWVRLGVLFLVLIAVSFGLAALFDYLLSPLKDELKNFAWLAYIIVFATSLLSNLTVIAPVSVGAAIMLAAAKMYHPALIALFAAAGGTLGELGGYYAGTLGKKVLVNEYPEAYDRVTGWVKRYGVWAISFLAFQPILPFDVAGIVAGASRMRATRFLLACFLGKFPKYLIIIYFFTQVTDLIPFL
jgi:membrane protein YqaA with SNARE-associated domain